MEYVPIADLHGDLADLHPFPLGEAVGYFAAHHAPDNPVLGDIVGSLVHRLNSLAVPNDGDIVGDVRNLVELMGNDNGGHALFLETKQQIKQRLGIRLIEGRGGFVQNQKPGVLGQRLGDFHHLLLAHADVPNQRPGGLGQAHRLQMPVRLRVGRAPINVEGPAPLVPQKHVLPDGHVGNQRQLLMDDDDALGFAVLDLGEPAHLALIDDVAGV